MYRGALIVLTLTMLGACADGRSTVAPPPVPAALARLAADAKPIPCSTVVGVVQARDAGPDPDAIPWLLLGVASTSGRGVLSATSSIQRIGTAGGKAPAKESAKESAKE